MRLKSVLSCLLCLWINNAAAESYLIKNARLYTAAGTDSSADVLLVDGRIKTIGNNINVDEKITTIAANGAVLTPALFNSYTHLGVSEIDAIASTVDTYSQNSQLTAALKIADAFNPSSVMIPHNRSNGLHYALVVPESAAGLFAGQATLVKLASQAYVVDDSVAVVVQLGEQGQALAGGSRAAAMALLRQALDEAQHYASNQAAANKGQRWQYSNSYADLAALQAVVKGRKPLLVKVSRAADIQQVLVLAKQYQLNIILAGAQEGWKVAEAIAAAKVPVIMDPIENLPLAYETLAARLDNAQLLQQAGVTLLFTGMSWHNTHNAYLVRQSAGNAVANGLTKASAMAAITANPAAVFGLNKQGDIKEGYAADLVLWNGDPLEVMSYPRMVFVDGKPVSQHSRQQQLRDRYYSRAQRAKP
ncbi:amidohydrolase family protein [Dasania sp. GY-MA-18]|uniref:Amidohydrolase family protein n=1 Tax=Dasania phycosphaerae TaxID=2950436 RepID=A0A9J6RQF6_9GAMM|nr:MULTISPECIES: amidohydrolase family protein [Dasania]MCR8924281.1 amidohydrolase family protein [Dasania sp. GY-MA-18]MCZ0866934.1 amidohydrolase family protein [Dasania phycosphaerae]MCZ0870438.1 amidohydrolase family protein [Dasania phycosphaerae]